MESFLSFLRDNYLVFVVIGSVFAFFIIRDTVTVLNAHRMRAKLKEDMMASEKRIETILDQLNQNRNRLDHSILSIQNELKKNAQSIPSSNLDRPDIPAAPPKKS